MDAFAHLFHQLDTTTATQRKVEAMASYFQQTAARDAAWALFVLTGNRFKRLVTAKDLRDWTLQWTGLPDWLFEDSYRHVGDTAEVISLLLANYFPEPEQASHPRLSLADWMEGRLLALQGLSKTQQQALLHAWLQELTTEQRFILCKLLTGAFRVGVSKTLVIRALAKATGVDQAVLTHRLTGTWTPTPTFYDQLISPDTDPSDIRQPFPFCLAHPLEQPPENLGLPQEWLAEWKWDGIRAQLLHGVANQTALWSRGEELVSDTFPELLQAAAAQLPDGTVLDGEILAFQSGQPLPFSSLQKRLGRKKVTPALQQQVPVVFMAYDLLALGREDCRTLPLQQRRTTLETLFARLNGPLVLSQPVAFDTWEALAHLRSESRQRRVEGLMLKRLTGAYGVGRKKGNWWKWKIDPFTVDAVLLYAQPGSGRRASLYTDYTFAVWHNAPAPNDDRQLVPIAKAYSGLTDAEIRKLDHWIRQHTLERFGPVRAVTPALVFELGFEGIAASSRHKSGIALRFPRILRWRQDKTMAEADTLESLQQLARLQDG